MNMTATFYAVFYDMEQPLTIKYAMHKRIESCLFKNLTDDNGTKSVQLKDHDGNVADYDIRFVSTFKIQNTVDCNLYAVCYCKKIG